MENQSTRTILYNTEKDGELKEFTYILSEGEQNDNAIDLVRLSEIINLKIPDVYSFLPEQIESTKGSKETFTQCSKCECETESDCTQINTVIETNECQSLFQKTNNLRWFERITPIEGAVSKIEWVLQQEESDLYSDEKRWVDVPHVNSPR